jgi:hypothetical protein
MTNTPAITGAILELVLAAVNASALRADRARGFGH